MYLIFNQACKYNLFREIVSMSTYSTVYHDKTGKDINFKKSTTDLFITGAVKAPTGITVIGGKTGTTTAAGHCLIILASDTSGKDYIAVVMQSATSDNLYSEMTGLLGLIKQS
jgi:D-alanyl-D-alanine carboxypeptidase